MWEYSLFAENRQHQGIKIDSNVLRNAFKTKDNSGKNKIKQKNPKNWANRSVAIINISRRYSQKCKLPPTPASLCREMVCQNLKNWKKTNKKRALILFIWMILVVLGSYSVIDGNNYKRSLWHSCARNEYPKPVSALGLEDIPLWGCQACPRESVGTWTRDWQGWKRKGSWMQRRRGRNGGSAGSSLGDGGCDQQSHSCPNAVWGDDGDDDGGGGGWGCGERGPGATPSRGSGQSLHACQVSAFGLGQGPYAFCCHLHSGSRKRGTQLWV